MAPQGPLYGFSVNSERGRRGHTTHTHRTQGWTQGAEGQLCPRSPGQTRARGQLPPPGAWQGRGAGRARGRTLHTESKEQLKLCKTGLGALSIAMRLFTQS